MFEEHFLMTDFRPEPIQFASVKKNKKTKLIVLFQSKGTYTQANPNNGVSSKHAYINKNTESATTKRAKT